jgi:hypothetical protein
VFLFEEEKEGLDYSIIFCSAFIKVPQQELSKCLPPRRYVDKGSFSSEIKI